MKRSEPDVLAFDSNVLIHAFLSDSDLHEPAFEHVRSAAEQPAAWAIPWPCIHEFFAVVTNPKLTSSPRRVEQAVRQVDAWMASPSLQLISETRGHWRTLSRLINSAHAAGPVVHDAKIAAICIDHRVSEFVTLDRDFDRFPELAVRSILD